MENRGGRAGDRERGDVKRGERERERARERARKRESARVEEWAEVDGGDNDRFRWRARTALTDRSSGKISVERGLERIEKGEEEGGGGGGGGLERLEKGKEEEEEEEEGLSA